MAPRLLRLLPRVRRYTLLLLPGWIAAAPTPPAAPAPANVLVLANSRDPDSLALARHYLAARGVPEANLVALPLPTEETISRAQFTAELWEPLTDWLRAQQWVDLLPMEPVEGVHFIQGDFTEADVLAQLQAIVGDRPVDVVVSDMAPNLSGIDSVDAARISHLIELAVEFAQLHLKPQGALVVKVFHGSGYSQLVKLFKDSFKVVKPIKPKASRDKSSEQFLVGIEPKNRPISG